MPTAWIRLVLLLQATSALNSAVANTPVRPLIYLNSTEGTRLLKAASHDAPYWQVAPVLETQLPGQCGPTTAAVLLNALAAQGLRAPESEEFSYHNPLFSDTVHYWEQHNVVNSSTCARRVYAGWVGALQQVAALMECAGPKVKAVQLGQSNAAAFRKELVAAFESSPLRYVSVNFDRRTLGQEGVGHHSPVGAYDAGTDRALVMDVARYKYPPAWVGIEDLVVAMTGGAGPFGTPRGFLVVQMPPAWGARAVDAAHQLSAAV
mmetsp:Transcript_82650/g.229328  ORF Transcript_82650/g.229328 Transcript_82650/m.229328 type:complete len:263 (-) Transcript_82650:130-918(-)